MEKKDIIKIIEHSFIIVVAIAMLLYGIGKPLQFSDASHSNKTVGEMTGMELMWAFYGYSRIYPILLGISEVGGAILLCLARTRLLGCILLTGILLNVIIQDVLYGVNEGALRAAITYQIMIFGILWINRAGLIAGLKAMMPARAEAEPGTRKKFVLFTASVLLAVLLKMIEVLITH